MAGLHLIAETAGTSRRTGLNQNREDSMSNCISRVDIIFRTAPCGGGMIDIDMVFKLKSDQYRKEYGKGKQGEV